MYSRIFKTVFALTLTAVAGWLATSGVGADGTGITFSGCKFGSPSLPCDGSTWPAGPDYATDVLGNPWDFSDFDDVDRDPGSNQGWNPFSPTNGAGTPGTAGGTSSTNSATMGILYSGYYNALNPGRNGRRYPVETSRYQKFAVRLTASRTEGALFLRWFHLPWGHPSNPFATTGASRLDNGAGTQAGSQILAGALTNLNSGTAWTDGTVVGLRLDDNGISAGNTTTYDWARLTVKDDDPTSALQTIAWSGGTATTVEVIDSLGTAYPIASNVSSPVANWNYGILPLGVYTFRITLSNSTVLTRPNVTINAPPVVFVTDPDETGGEDFATTVLGNAWDMTESTDVQFTTPPSENLALDWTFNGQFNATNDGTRNGPGFMLLYQTNNSVPIDTSKYRYFTVRFQVDGAFDLGNGSVARVLWSQLGFNGDTATTTRSFIVWEGMNSYTFDLAPLTTAADEGLEPLEGTPTQWGNGQKFYFNFHPHEFNLALPSAVQRRFHIDDIKLAAMDKTSSGIFPITWNSSDANGHPISVRLYYDTDTDPKNGPSDPASGLTLITQGLAASGSHVWNAIGTGVPTGEYYIYAVANDGVQDWGRYSTGKVLVAPDASTPNPSMNVESPTNGSAVIQPLTVSGWAIDRGADTGAGIDRIEVLVNGTLHGAATLFGSRPDIGSLYGSRFTNSGFTYTINGLNPGSYTLTVRARSTVSGTYNQQQQISITIPTSNPLMSVDVPTTESQVGSVFTIAGWAVDRAAPSGAGVDRVAAYAYPIPGFNQGVNGNPHFLGYLNVGNARPDIGGALGSQFTNSGFSGTFNATALGVPTAACYRIYVYARSLVASLGDPGAGYNNYSAPLDVFIGTTASDPVMYIDTPQPGTVLSSSQPFTVAGWAFDRGASSGSGIFDVHVWAFPVSGPPNAFVWSTSSQAGSLGGARQDIANAYGAQFLNSGYNMTVPAGRIGPGTYDFYVFTFCALVGTSQPCQARVNRVTVNP